MKEETQMYFNFPVQLLEGFMVDHKNVLNNIFDYAVFAGTIDLKHGTELEKLKSSADYFSVKIGKPSKVLSNGEMLHDSLPKNSPRVGLSLPIFWDYYNNEKTEFEKGCFLTFLAIKSIVGRKEYCKTTNNLIMARMEGKAKSIFDDSELSEEIYFFYNRYQLTKIINELKSNWGLVYYSRHIRGFYVSFKIDFESLVRIAEKARETTKLKKSKALENDIVKKVLESMKATPP